MDKHKIGDRRQIYVDRRPVRLVGDRGKANQRCIRLKEIKTQVLRQFVCTF